VALEAAASAAAELLDLGKKALTKKATSFEVAFLLVAVSKLKLESQTSHDVESRLCVVVRKIAPHISISCIGGVA
jgi:hypothetical protein